MMKNQWKSSIHIQNFAMAKIKGNSEYPNLHGKVYFQQKSKGVLITAEVFGLPNDEKICSNEIFGFHIHEGNECTGTKEDPFANAKSHYDIAKCKHPEHAGDMPPLFGNQGYAYLSFFQSTSFRPKQKNLYDFQLPRHTRLRYIQEDVTILLIILTPCSFLFSAG